MYYADDMQYDDGFLFAAFAEPAKIKMLCKENFTLNTNAKLKVLI